VAEIAAEAVGEFVAVEERAVELGVGETGGR
jgi:hypothetical protein